MIVSSAQLHKAIQTSLLCAVSVIGVATATQAAEPTVKTSETLQSKRTVTAPSDEPLQEVVVTLAPYGVAESSALANVTILKRSELDLKPAVGLGDLLSSQPGIRSSAFAPGASRPVIRGLQGPRVQVLTNGVGMIDASALSPDHAVASDPAGASRIEVLRGPSALAYGGSAVGGVVNVIDDRIPTQVPVDGLDGRIALQGASVDKSLHGAFSVTGGKGPWAFSLDAVRRRAKDFKTPVGPESRRLTDLEGEEPDTRKKVDNSFARLTEFGGGLSYLGDWGYVGLGVKQTQSRYGVPVHMHAEHDHEADHEEGHGHEDEHGEEAVSIRLKQTRYDLRGDVRTEFGPFTKTRFNVGYTDYSHTEYEGAETGTVFDSTGVEGRIELVQAERNGWKGAVGLQGLTRDFKAKGAEAFVPSTDIREVGIFTLQRYEDGNWGIEGGLRFDRRTLKTPAVSRSFNNTSVSMGVFARPTENSFVGLSVSRSGRAPTEAELFANGPHPATASFEVGDRTLTSEVVNSLEATAHYELTNLDIDLHAYVSRYDGFIDLRPTGEEEDGLPKHKFVQTDARFHGFEAEARWTAWQSGDTRLRLDGGFDWMRGKTDLGNPARMAPWALNAKATLDKGPWTAALEARQVGKQTRVAKDELPTDGYTLVNLFVSVKPVPASGLTLFLEGRNLGNEEAREHTSFLKDLVPLPGRSVRGGLTWSF
ncbi:MAG: TonB-dependent receptor [Asticcacaulis sp.]